MSIDQELITRVQQIATGEIAHRVRALIACYVGFVGLVDQSPELRARAEAIESTLRRFCATGQLPKTGPAARMRPSAG